MKQGFWEKIDRAWLVGGTASGATLVILGVLASSGSLLGLSLVVATAGVWGGGLAYYANQVRRREQEQWQNVNQNVADLASRTKALFEFLAHQFNGQFDSIKDENGQVKTLLADAIEKLINSFTSLEEQTRRQQDIALGLTKKGSEDQESGQLNIESFLSEIDQVLRSFTEAISRNSELARTMVKSMNETSSQFQKVLGMLDEVKKIADQTNLLAINAAVEAARAGQAGKGFAVVAEEVRNLSIRSNRFSDQIGASVTGITEALGKVEEVIHQMATQDEAVTGSAKSRVDDLMTKTRTFNGNIENSVHQISDSSERVASEVRHAVTSLQFQDLATQVLGTSNNRIENLESLLDKLAILSLEHREPSADLKDDCQKRLVEFKVALDAASRLLERASHNPVSQKNLNEGDIELF